MEARLTGGFGYAPCAEAEQAPRTSREDLVPDVRCSEVPAESDRWGVLFLAVGHLSGLHRPAGRFRGPAEDRTAPAGEHTAGVAELVMGEDPAAAVDWLEEAAEAEPENPDVLSDLAAAYLERARRLDQPRDLAQAFETAVKALEADPAHLEALFNRALALGSLFPSKAAEKAWEDYLQADPHSPYAEEARQHLARLQEPTAVPPLKEEMAETAFADTGENEASLRAQVEALPQDAWSLAVEWLFRRWPAAVADPAEEDPEAVLTALERLTAAMAETGGDASLGEAAGRIREAASTPAFDHLVEGYRLLGLRDFMSCAGRPALRQDMEAAARVLESEEEPLAAWARLEIARCDLLAQNLEASGVILRGLPGEPLRPASAVFRGQAQHLAGYLAGGKGDVTGAIKHFSESLEAYAGAGYLESVLRMDQELAALYWKLGQDDQFWTHLYSPVASLRTYRGDGAFQPLTFGGQYLASEAPALAEVINSELIERAVVKPAYLAHGLTYRALARQRAGRLSEAYEDIEEALSILAQMDENGFRSRLEADTLVAHGRIVLGSDPGGALGALDRSIEHFRATGYTSYLASIHLARARARLAVGDPSGAEEDLRAGIAESQRQAVTVQDEAARVAFQDQGKELFDELLALALERGAPAEETLAIVERGRGQALLARLLRWRKAAAERDRAAQVALQGPDLSEVQRTIPEGTALLEYSFVKERLVSWLVTRGRITFFDHPRAQNLEGRVAGLRAAIQAGWPLEELRPRSEELFTSLFSPLSSALGGMHHLAIVPDGPLHLLPFAALRDPETGRFLIEAHSFSIIPSTAVYAELRRRPRLDPAEGELAIFADPAFDPKAFPSFSRLPAAAREAREIATLYPPDKVVAFTAETATKAKFLNALGLYRTIYYAGHAEPIDREPFLSRLALSPDKTTGDSGALHARDLYQSEHAGTEVVILAACDTASGWTSKTEGALSLARPFLGGGASTVLATLWRIEDIYSAEFFARYHRILLSRDSTIGALRLAQLEMITGPQATGNSSAWWSAMQAYGVSPDRAP